MNVCRLYQGQDATTLKVHLIKKQRKSRKMVLKWNIHHSYLSHGGLRVWRLTSPPQEVIMIPGLLCHHWKRSLVWREVRLARQLSDLLLITMWGKLLVCEGFSKLSVFIQLMTSVFISLWVTCLGNEHTKLWIVYRCIVVDYQILVNPFLTMLWLLPSGDNTNRHITFHRGIM